MCMIKNFYFILLIFIAPAAFAQRTYIQCGKLIDGIANKAQTEVTIVVDGNMITGIQKGYVSGNAGDKVIDLKNKTVMPGLIDCHVHMESQVTPHDFEDQFKLNPADYAFQSIGFADSTLMAGFTTVRDVGGSGVDI